VVLHIAEGNFAGTVSWLQDASQNPGSSAHFVVGKSGEIAQLVSVHDGAWGNGLCWSHGHWATPDCAEKDNPGWADIVQGVNPNLYTISIEHEGHTGEALTPAMKAATVRLLKWIAGVFHMTYVPGHTLIGHCDIDPVRRSHCPGSAFNFNEIAQAANATGDGITENSALLAPPRAGEQQAKAYIVKLGSTAYNAADIGVILHHYWTYAVPAGLDPLLAVAQCIHETSAEGHPISIWWAQRPRRNPAGIGVTGETRNTPPPDAHNWAGDPTEKPAIWRAGLSFETWEEAARAHIGRLLAYAIPDGHGTDAQKALIAFALGLRPLGSSLRGSAPTLRALGAHHNPTGMGWATPGDNYGAKIASIAVEIQGTE
jgi:N-acetyl-anhydromuramyl-L-alanine amidase AmpD